MDLIRHFADLHNGDIAVAGGKGASLGELTRLEIPVPPGFVILADAYEWFLTETGLVSRIASVLDALDKEDSRGIQHAAEELRVLMLTAGKPRFLAAEVARHFPALGSKYVAVRSSATAEDGLSASWAGQFETYLNATEADLLDSVMRCWASLFSPSAISYRLEHGLREQHISVAVIVQKMVNSSAAGTAFSVHPVLNDETCAVIEAVFGLGEPLVSGLLTPDTYVIDKRTCEIVDIHITEQERGLFCARNGGTEWVPVAEPERADQKLRSAEILALADLVARIEQHYAFPVDVEWAREGDQLYILQARPITGLRGAST